MIQKHPRKRFATALTSRQPALLGQLSILLQLLCDRFYYY